MGNDEKKLRKVQHVFFVLDVSGKMAGFRIAMLNCAMAEVVAAMQKGNRANEVSQIKIAILTYSTGSMWLNPDGPENLEDFVWGDLQAGGMADLGAALQELNDKLSRRKYMWFDTGCYAPVIVFVSCRWATDDYQMALQELQKNNWFLYAIKIGFALRDEPDAAEILQYIVGNSEVVFLCSDQDGDDSFPKIFKSAFALLSKSIFAGLVWPDGDRGRTRRSRDSGAIQREMSVPGAEPLPQVDDDLWDNADGW